MSTRFLPVAKGRLGASLIESAGTSEPLPIAATLRSPLMSSAALRVAGALVVIALLWLGVGWALQ